MNKLEVSEIQISPVKHANGLVGFASFVINNQFYIGNIAIYTSPRASKQYRLAYPIKKCSNNSHINIFHPITKEAGDYVQDKVVSEYMKIIEKVVKGEQYEGNRADSQGVCKE